jgi:hypothetical protein
MYIRIDTSFFYKSEFKAIDCETCIRIDCMLSKHHKKGGGACSTRSKQRFLLVICLASLLALYVAANSMVSQSVRTRTNDGDGDDDDDDDVDARKFVRAATTTTRRRRRRRRRRQKHIMERLKKTTPEDEDDDDDDDDDDDASGDDSTRQQTSAVAATTIRQESHEDVAATEVSSHEQVTHEGVSHEPRLLSSGMSATASTQGNLGAPSVVTNGLTKDWLKDRVSWLQMVDAHTYACMRAHTYSHAVLTYHLISHFAVAGGERYERHVFTAASVDHR